MKVKVPCHNCKDRYVGCHGKCDKYKKYKIEYEKEKEIRKNNGNDLFWINLERRMK